jgi:hypothetical protein
MKADTVDLAAIFGQAIHYVVPLYQRPYVWTREAQWEPLWEDVRSVADRQIDATPTNDNIPHFLGAVVLEQTLNQVGMIGSRTIIDGQQRLTTLQLVIAAARSLAIERGLSGPRKMFEKLLFNDDFLVHKAGDEYKVVPTQRDQAAFQEALGDGIVASSGSHRMHEAYRYFRGAILEWAAEGADSDADFTGFRHLISRELAARFTGNGRPASEIVSSTGVRSSDTAPCPSMKSIEERCRCPVPVLPCARSERS